MVAPPVADASSWLSPSYPAVVGQPMEKVLSTPNQLSFPNEFPYEFDSSTFSTPHGDSTETEDETSDDEDDFLAGLTRRLALSTQRLPSPPSLVTDKAELKPQVTESTQSGLGSPNGPFSQVPSPPTSPFREEDSLRVLSAAAGQVAKIKMANFDAKPVSRPNHNPNSLVPFPQNAAFCDYYHYYWPWQPHYHQSQVRRVPNAWLVSPSPVRGIFSAPTAVKSPSAGTGVFLPRKYSVPSDSRKKAGGGCVRFPSKVVQQQSPKIEDFSGRCQPNSQACLSNGRSKINNVAGNGCLKQERPPLPQEWMY